MECESMNMLTNKVAFGLLSEDEKQLFRDSLNYCECYTESGTWNKWNNAGALVQDVILRLKLKEGEWYKYKDKYGGNTFEWTDNKKSDFIKCDLFRPATQEEINSVKPKETFVDVEIRWSDKAGIIETPYGRISNTSMVKFGDLVEGWFCAGFNHKETHMPVRDSVFFGEEMTRVLSRADTVRFVRVD